MKKHTKEPLGEAQARKRLNSIRGKLEEMKAYKRILQDEGLIPDADDKVRESKLIVQLLRIEKQYPALKQRVQTNR